MYRQLFAWVVTFNLVALILAATGAWPWAFHHRVQFALANTLISVLARNEVGLQLHSCSQINAHWRHSFLTHSHPCIQVFLRVLYTFMVKTVTLGTKHGLGTLWAPVFVRNLITAFLLHVGGVHSGAGVGSLMWLVYGSVYMIISYAAYNIWIVLLGYALLVTVFLTVVSATPFLRFHYHNVFEHLHRYAGWSSLLVMAIFIILLQGGKTYQWHKFVASYWLWVTIVTVLLVALPWACVSRVPVMHEVPESNRITLLKFPGYIEPGFYGRISHKRLSEWHVFGCFGESVSQPHHFMICSAVGDFTKDLAKHPPSHLYTRLIKFPGFSYCHRMYGRGIAICTGAAIGVFISLFSNEGLTNFDLIWVGSKFQDTYGSTVLSLLRKGCPGDRLTLYDTSLHGRPNLVSLACAAYYDKQAEAVFCVSNRMGTLDLVHGCRRVGVPAFGPIWDA